MTARDCCWAGSAGGAAVWSIAACNWAQASAGCAAAGCAQENTEAANIADAKIFSTALIGALHC